MDFIDLKAQQARIRPRIDAAIRRVLDHGQYIMGPEIEVLEDRLCAFSGASHAISCASGTDALALVLMAHGIRPGDAVFVPAFTFVASAEVVAWLGATPVFVDVLPDTFNIDCESLAASIGWARNNGLRPAMVMPVDMFGLPADYAGVRTLAEAHGLFVLADAAQSFGAALDGARTGTLGDATATSFFPAKPLGCYGDGGAIFTDDADFADVIRSLRVHGEGAHKYDNVRVGINGRMDTMQAAILIEKLAIFEDELVARKRIADAYARGLDTLCRVPVTGAARQSAWAQYTIRTSHRQAIQDACRDAGIPTAVYYPKPLNQQTAYRHYPVAPGGVPVSEQLAGEVLSLPMHPYLDTESQQRIIDTVVAALDGKVGL